MPSIFAVVCESDQDYFKQYRAIFNKITTAGDTIPKLVKEFGELIDGESNDRIKEIVAMYFGKAIAEPVFSNAYVQFTVKSSRRVEFRKAFIRECQQQFEQNVLNVSLTNQLSPQKIDNVKITQNATDITRFLGELLSNEILTPNIMISIVNALLERNTQLHFECLCNLLTVAGAWLENKIRKYSGQVEFINKCFKKMLDIAQNEDQNIQIYGRVRSLILDVIDLRKNNWPGRREARRGLPFTSGQNQRIFVSRNRNNGTENRGCKKPVKSANNQSHHSENIDPMLERIKDLLKSEIDINTIHEFITANLVDGTDAESIRIVLRTVVECLMEDDTLKLRGNVEAASILRMLFELLEK